MSTPMLMQESLWFQADQLCAFFLEPEVDCTKLSLDTTSVRTLALPVGYSAPTMV